MLLPGKKTVITSSYEQSSCSPQHFFPSRGLCGFLSSCCIIRHSSRSRFRFATS
jgi:hypothetical protein